MADENRFGLDWSDDEVDFIIADYFEMLRAELNGVDYNKSAHRRSRVERIGRTEGSVERKHQNISAVLIELALPTISGYKPLPNFQKSIIEGIERYLTRNPGDLIPEPSAKSFGEAPSLFVEQPPVLQTVAHRDKELVRLVRKFDPVERDFRNRSLGKAGEELIFAFERQRLITHDRTDLARKVRWVSQEDGDGAGYDIHSFDHNGSERLIEVKTTNGLQTTPFYLTRNELSFSNERPREFRICRLYDFSRKPKLFELEPPIEKLVRLEPLSFAASFH
ncbi:DUF3883 domain-containing protein [Bradyrhizobium erythrophlei]|uniref:Protein NO VEIN C-terminal domain-containing protein n=1 Tax=Bradyrhizobium erythrophlei TaxID=1437360 RepID=A0A1H5CCJ1_9BRAD|nr:DUF3883 domain-containing protein [Bradyrhizobium erythrophlei]SED64503.1 protein of unknown function [Bradyrhizobium erythrophlei]